MSSSTQGVGGCSGVLETLEEKSPHFPYIAYSQHVANSLEEEWKSGPRELSLYTDERLKGELFSFYGQIDEASPKFQNLFRSYREERLDQIREWIEERGDKSRIDEESSYQLNSDPEITDHLTMYLQQNFSSSCQLDPFNLPRPKRRIRKEDISKSLINFDQEIHLADPPIIPPAAQKAMSPQLIKILMSAFRNNPTGIALEVLLKDLQKKLKNSPESLRLGELLERFGNQIAFIQDFPFKGETVSLLYPVFNQSLVVTPLIMFDKIWHKIKFIVNVFGAGIMRTSKAFQLLSEIFGWEDIIPEKWGFESKEDFLNFMIKYYLEDYKVISGKRLTKNESARRRSDEEAFYIVTVANEAQKKYISEQLAKSVPKPKDAREIKKTIATPSLSTPGIKPNSYNYPSHPWGPQHNFFSTNAPKPEVVNKPPSTVRVTATAPEPFPSLSAGAPQKRNSNSNAAPQPGTNKPKTWNKLF